MKKVTKIIGLHVFLAWLGMAFSCNRSDCHIDNNAARCDTVFVERVRVDTVVVRDTIYVDNNMRGDKPISILLLYEPPKLDSLATRKVLEKSLWSNSIDTRGVTAGKEYELFLRPDLEYLPYFTLAFNRLAYNDEYAGYSFVRMCTSAIDDKKLFSQGKSIVNRYNCGRQRSVTYNHSYNEDNVWSEDGGIPFALTAIDSLRVRVVAHNDRNALAALEKYYHDKGDDKGIAIYYKVMLSHDGNGDLAERFYRVLEPYFKETPEYRIAVREVLLRAALCDHNARAQELCDSLGYSLCDYKLPKIE